MCRRFFKSLYLLTLFTVTLFVVLDTFTILQFRNNVMQTVDPAESQHVMKELYRLAEEFDEESLSFYNCKSDTLTISPPLMTALKAVQKTAEEAAPGDKLDDALKEALKAVGVAAQKEADLQKAAQVEDSGRFIALSEVHRCGFKRLDQLYVLKKTFTLLSPFEIATMPGDYLTLIVTLAMGALGSLLYITKHFVEQVLNRHQLNADTRHEPISWFLFRPILGMITALVMFIFIKAGQLSFANPGASGSGQIELNPYVVSFIAITSGYLCWQAIESIQKAGERFFSGRIENPRWAYGLEEVVESHGKSLLIKSGKAKTEITAKEALAHGVTQLAQQLEVSEAQLTNWVNQKEAVPQDIQDQIAHLLSINPPKLFTDIPPSLQS